MDKEMILIFFVVIPLGVLGIGWVTYKEIKSEIYLCKRFYPEMDKLDCFFAPKYLPLQEGEQNDQRK